MKTNHESIIHHIQEAIRACKEDSALQTTKNQLVAALRLVEGVSNKRNARESQSTFYAEQAKKRNEEWLKMLKNGLKFPKEEEDDT